MRANARSLLVLAVALSPFVLSRGLWEARLALLPGLDASDLQEARISPEEQARLWREYQAALQCEALEPCLSLLDLAHWEGEPQAIAAACSQARDRLEALPVPAALPPDVRANAELLRGHWLRELEADADLAAGKAGFSFRSGSLDTCTATSIPARLDQLYGLRQPGQPPASCADLQGG